MPLGILIQINILFLFSCFSTHPECLCTIHLFGILLVMCTSQFKEICVWFHYCPNITHLFQMVFNTATHNDGNGDNN